MKNLIKFSIIIFFALFIFSIQPSQAALMDGFNCADNTGCNCDLNDFVRIGIKVTTIIFGVCGSIALLAFVAGGFMMVASAGNADMVKRGKDTIFGAVIGLAIIFTSFIIIKYVVEGLGGTFNPTAPAVTSNCGNSSTNQSTSDYANSCYKSAENSLKVCQFGCDSTVPNCQQACQKQYDLEIGSCGN